MCTMNIYDDVQSQYVGVKVGVLGSGCDNSGTSYRLWSSRKGIFPIGC
jgi:hypothetical protein